MQPLNYPPTSSPTSSYISSPISYGTGPNSFPSFPTTPPHYSYHLLEQAISSSFNDPSFSSSQLDNKLLYSQIIQSGVHLTSNKLSKAITLSMFEQQSAHNNSQMAPLPKKRDRSPLRYYPQKNYKLASAPDGSAIIVECTGSENDTSSFRPAVAESSDRTVFSQRKARGLHLRENARDAIRKVGRSTRSPLPLLNPMKTPSPQKTTLRCKRNKKENVTLRNIITDATRSLQEGIRSQRAEQVSAIENTRTIKPLRAFPKSTPILRSSTSPTLRSSGNVNDLEHRKNVELQIEKTLELFKHRQREIEIELETARQIEIELEQERNRQREINRELRAIYDNYPLPPNTWFSELDANQDRITQTTPPTFAFSQLDLNTSTPNPLDTTHATPEANNMFDQFINY